MFMKTKVLFNTVAAVILLLVLCGCRGEKNRDFNRLVLNNKALEREIIEYRKREDQHPAYEGTKVYTSVWCKEINDSTVRYVLRPFSDPAELDKYPVSFICKVDGEDVFFIMGCGVSKTDYKNNFFKMSERNKACFKKKYFPKIYYNRDGKLGPYCYSHPLLTYLTFVNDSLVGNNIGYGDVNAKVLIFIDEKPYWW